MSERIMPVSDRPRSQRTHTAVIESTAALLKSSGFSGVTIDRIAAHSGVSTASIYKHWPSKTAVIAEAFGKTAEAALPVYQTGNPVEDLIECAVAAVAFHGTPAQWVFVELLAACAVEPSGAAYLQEYYLGPRRDAIRPLWEAAVEAGAVRDDVDSDTALDTIFGAAVFRLMRRIEDDDLRGTIELSIVGLLA